MTHASRIGTLPRQQTEDVPDFSPGNVIALIVAILILSAFACIVFRIPRRLYRLSLKMTKAKPKENTAVTEKTNNGAAGRISEPLTPPQGSIFGRWSREMLRKTDTDDVESQKGDTTGSSEGLSPTSDTISLLVKPDTAYISPKQKKSTHVVRFSESKPTSSSSNQGYAQME